MTTITIRSNDPERPTVQYTAPTYSVLSALEDALHVLWELLPSRRSWVSDLGRTDCASFDYMCEEAALVHWVGPYEFEVEHFW